MCNVSLSSVYIYRNVCYGERSSLQSVTQATKPALNLTDVQTVWKQWKQYSTTCKSKYEYFSTI